MEDLKKSRVKDINFLVWFNSSRLIAIVLLIVFIFWYWYTMFGIVFWRDEAHALLIASNNSSLLGLFKAVRYEGTPGLWHLILWVIGKFLPLTPFVAKAIHFAFFGAFLVVLLFLIKIPNLFRLFILLQFPVLYNTVYVRQYQIASFLILLFTYLYIYTDRENNVWLYIVIFLLSQTCLHSVIISFGLFVFLILTNYCASRKIFNRYYIISIIGFVLALIQLIPPKDIIAGLSTWNLSFTIANFFDVEKSIISDAFLDNMVLGLFLIVIFFIYLRSNINRIKSLIINLCISFFIIFSGFFSVSLMKYSHLRHHVLLTYVVISFVIILIDYVKVKILTNKWVYIVLSPLLVFSLFQFIENTDLYRSQLRSNSKNVAEFLDENYPRKEILAMSEIFEEPIRVYRKNQVPVFALGRQDYVKYTVWNDPSVDYRKYVYTEHIKLSHLIEEINATPRAILIKEPIIILSGYNSLPKMNDIGLPSLRRIDINNEFHLEYIIAFTGAQNENYYLYLVRHTVQERNG